MRDDTVMTDRLSPPRLDDVPAWQATFQEAVAAATTTADCTAAFEAVLARFTIDCFACGEVDLAERDRSTFYVIGWPEEWRRFYLESGLIERDPLLHALETRRSPFTWTELRADPGLSPDTRRLFKLAEKSGWTEGLVIPISRSETRVGLVSLAARRPPFSALEKAELTLAAVYFHQHVRVLASGNFPTPPAGLSSREITALTMVAEGLSDRSIAERLNISATTAHEHVERAKRKLHAKSRASAVAIAITLGIVKL